MPISVSGRRHSCPVRLRLAANFSQSNHAFSRGDFNYDGIVNLQDFNILASRFGTALAPHGTFTSLAAGETDERDLLDL